MRTFKFMVMLLLAAGWVLLAGTASFASKPSYIVVDVGDGAVLGAHEAGRQWYPASLAKLMTVYVFLNAAAEGEVSLDDALDISKAAAAQPARKAYLQAGKTIKANKAMLAAIVHSANDAAVVLAEAVAGSEADFVELMNEAAESLGMTATHFTNASGLPDPDARITARDTALLALKLIESFPDHLAMFSQRSVKVGKRRLATGNGLLDVVKGATGMKTGFTCWSGYNAVLTTRRKGRTLVTVILGAPSRAVRNGRAIGVTNATFKSHAGGEPIADYVALTPEGKPDRVLADGKCNRLLNASGSGVGYLPGWGVLFGAYPKQKQAWARIGKMVRLLKPSERRGRRTIVPSSRRPLRMYNALLVGLRRKDVLVICNRLKEKKEFCQGLPPKWLNNPRAVWR
jgi:D-alanyl-D-alanine carboxypeptidase